MAPRIGIEPSLGCAIPKASRSVDRGSSDCFQTINVLEQEQPMLETHTGGCFCGAVRYSTKGQPARSAVCHCRYCQLRTGTAFGISVYFSEDQVTFNDGACDTFSYETEGGNTATLSRCKNCGTTVSWRISIEALSDLVGIAGGTFDPPTFWYELGREVFTRSKADFCQIDAPESYEDSPIYKPIKRDDGHLKGGI